MPDATAQKGPLITLFFTDIRGAIQAPPDVSIRAVCLLCGSSHRYLSRYSLRMLPTQALNTLEKWLAEENPR